MSSSTHVRLRKRQVVTRLLALGVLLLVIAAIAVSVGVPSRGELQEAFARAGWWAPALFAAMYAAATLSPLPKAIFTLAAGALFGLGEGLVVVVVGATAGAVAAFWIGRALGRDAVHQMTGRRMGRLEERLARRSLLVVLAARLVTVVPFTALNYLAGVTTLRMRDFLLGTVVGMLPATTAYVTVGAYGGDPGSWPFWAALGTLGLLTVVAAVISWWHRPHPSSAAPALRVRAVSERPTNAEDGSAPQ